LKENKGKGSDVVLQFPRGGKKERGVIVSITSTTLTSHRDAVEKKKKKRGKEKKGGTYPNTKERGGEKKESFLSLFSS